MKRGVALLLLLCLALPAAGEDAFQDVTVKDGDTLWGIANYYLKDPDRWPEILKYNHLPQADPTAALPGMKLKIPVLLIKERLRKANLVFLQNEVRMRKRDQPNWKEAYQGAELYNEDALRTLERAQAQVRFYGGDILKIDENSLVVLRPELKTEEANLLSGAVIASRTKLITATVQVSPRSPDTSYKARVRNDRATIVQVENGSAEVLGLDTGKKVVVPAGYANITLPHQAPTLPVRAPKLPGFQVAEFTPSGDPVPYKNVPAVWAEDASRRGGGGERTEAAEEQPKDFDIRNFKSYRLQVSADPQFGKALWDKVRPLGPDGPDADTRVYNLPDGKYYRRVAYIDQAGKASAFYIFPEAIIDTKPPDLRVTFPEDGYKTKQALLNIEGVTEPNTFLTVNGYPVQIKADGKFSWSVVLATPGANKITIVAKDRAGNQVEAQRTIFFTGE